MRLSIILNLVMLLSSIPAMACSIPLQDLTNKIASAYGNEAVLSTERFDLDSQEPIRRYLVTLADGNLVVLEQQHCEMRNIRVTLMSPQTLPSTSGVTAMAELLQMTPTWQHSITPTDARFLLLQQLGRLDQLKVGSDIDYSLDDVITSATDSTEAILSFTSSSSYSTQFKSILSIYIGVGGL